MNDVIERLQQASRCGFGIVLTPADIESLLDDFWYINRELDEQKDLVAELLKSLQIQQEEGK